jgi:hypothetical protein
MNGGHRRGMQNVTSDRRLPVVPGLRVVELATYAK